MSVDTATVAYDQGRDAWLHDEYETGCRNGRHLPSLVWAGHCTICATEIKP